MPLQPTPTRWFEVHLPREQAVTALEALARSHSIDLHSDEPRGEACFDSTELQRNLRRFDTLAGRFRVELPPAALPPARILESPEQLAAAALHQLRHWCLRLLQLRRRVLSAQREIARLRLLQECIEALGDAAHELPGMRHSGAFLCKAVLACKRQSPGIPTGGQLVSDRHPGVEHDFYLVATVPEQRPQLEAMRDQAACTTLLIPGWLPETPAEQRRLLAQRLQEQEAGYAKARVFLAHHREDPRVRDALADAELLHWYLAISLQPDSGANQCKLTGWTTLADPRALQKILQDAHVEARVVFSRPAPGLQPPVQLKQSRWNRPFRIFTDLLGTPGSNEIDPTPLLAILVPLLFGFMFPDLGHGLLLAAAGWLWSRREPAASVLVPCGLAAAGFGLLFGELFGLRGILPSPCGCPLDHPLILLKLALVVGVTLLALGQVIAGIEAGWRGEADHWLQEGAPLLLMYVTGIAGLFWPWLLPVTLAALIWRLIAIARLCLGHGPSCFGTGVGHLFESLMQLAVNTLSFLRVGAFALAHVALSMAVVEISEIVENSWLQTLLFVLGQVLVVALEGLVVMVQTTRLIAFEFFIRFMRFEGRSFRPLTEPGRPH